MGVTYKLRDEVVQFIIGQRQENPLFSCRQLAESASQRFGLHLSKSSVHDVLKASGFSTPRGRKPKDKFEIPQEKKLQIQSSLSKIKLIAPPAVEEPKKELQVLASPPEEPKINLMADVVETKTVPEEPPQEVIFLPEMKSAAAEEQLSEIYETAGKIFMKAAYWDLGIYTGGPIKETEWPYYLTYTKGVKVLLENGKDFFIDLPLPIERCIREVADGLINNIKPLIIHQEPEAECFRACMEGQDGFKIEKIVIVAYNDHILLEFDNIMVFRRTFMIKERLFVESNISNAENRAQALFFPQAQEDKQAIEQIVNLKGFDAVKDDENNITLLVENTYENMSILQEAVDRLNKMYLTDEENRQIKVKTGEPI